MNSEMRGLILSLTYDVAIFGSCFVFWLIFYCCSNKLKNTDLRKELKIHGSDSLDDDTMIETENSRTEDDTTESDNPIISIFEKESKNSETINKKASETQPPSLLENEYDENEAIPEIADTRNFSQKADDWFKFFKDRIFLLSKILQAEHSSINSFDRNIYLSSMLSINQMLKSIAIPGLSILLPFYLITPPNTPDQSIFQMATISNIDRESVGIWLVLFITIVYSFIGYYFAYNYWSNQKKYLPIEVLSTQPEYHTIFIRNINKDISAARIFEHFSHIFPGMVVAAHIIRDKDFISPNVYLSLSNANMPIINYHLPTFAMAIVSFKSVNSTEQCLYDPTVQGQYHDWEIEPACSPEDIVWKYINLNKFNIRFRRLFLNLGLVAVSLFGVPLASALKTLLPFLNYKQENDEPPNTILIVISTWFSPLYLFLLNSVLVPILVNYVGKFSGFWKHSQIHSYKIHANHIFFILNTLIIPLLSFTTIELIYRIISDTDIKGWSLNLWVLLQSSSGSFAYQYVVNATFLTGTSQLLQLAKIPTRLYDRFVKGRQTLRTLEYDFGYWHAYNLSILTVVLVYSVTTPLILFWGVCFFSLKYYIDKYNFMYQIFSFKTNQGERYISGLTVQYFIFSIGFFQFCMAGFFLYKNDFILNFCGMILLLISTLTWIFLLSRSLIMKQNRILPPSLRKRFRSSISLCQSEIDKLKYIYLPTQDFHDIIITSHYAMTTTTKEYTHLKYIS